MTYWKLERPSKRSGKKWKVRVPTSSGRGKTVAFGDATMSDYTIHKDKARRERYRTRHQNDRIDDPYAPGFWSWWSLWGESSDLAKAHADAVKRAKKILGVKKDPEGNEVVRKNPSSKAPLMGEAAQVIATYNVPPRLHAEFLRGLAVEWEKAPTTDLHTLGRIVLDRLGEDPHHYRRARRAHARVSPRVQACFDALLSLVQEQYPSLSCTVEVDEAAGERDGKACARAFAFCEDHGEGGAFRIAIAGKLNDPDLADDSRVDGILRHELAHAVLLHGGDTEHTERDADEVAESLFGSPIFYDEDDVQTTDPSAPGARRPRPEYLDDEQGRTLDIPRTNPYPTGTMHQLHTVEDVASCLDDCAAQGDAKTPRMLASQFSQQAKQVAGAQSRMLTTLAKAARHCANAIEARLGGEVDRAMASERLCERALADAESPGRKNPHFKQYDFRVSKSFLPALFNGDTSGLSSDDEVALDRFLARVMNLGRGHWAEIEEDAGFGKDEITGLGSDRALVAWMTERKNPEWAKKLGSGLYKGTRYAGETARDLYHGAREAHRASAPPVENPLNDLEAELSPEELSAFESMILRQYYSIKSFPNVTPREARLALLFREALRDRTGDYGWQAVKAVPAEHVSGTLPPGTLALIFEDVSQDADEIQFSAGWREIEQVTGASLQSYNSWSAYVTDNARRNPRRASPRGAGF